MLFAALRKRGVDFEPINASALAVDLDHNGLGEYDAVLIRCLSHSQAFYATRVLASAGVTTVNSHHVVATCGDKLLTSAALHEAGVPIPRTAVVFSPEAVLEAVEQMGYPAVLKPLSGSWGRLLAKVNDRDTAEAIVEHKATLGGCAHSVFYIQEYVDKPGRDIRTLVVGDEVVYAVYRCSAHWITNTARGGSALPCPLTPELSRLSLAAARAVGGGMLAVDLLETANGRLLVSEVNHTPEFHGAMQATDADVAGAMVDYFLRIATATAPLRAEAEGGR